MMRHIPTVASPVPASEQEMDLNMDRLAVLRQLEVSAAYRCPDMILLRDLVRQEASDEEQEVAVSHQCQKPPLHLQRAALEECAQFLEQLAVENPSQHSTKKKLVSSASQPSCETVHPSISSPSPSRPNMGGKKSTSQRLGRSPSGVMEAKFGEAPAAHRQGRNQRRLEKAALPFQHAEAVLRCIGTWRSRMSLWAYQAVDAYGFDRSHVATAFNLMDRYVSKVLQRHATNSPILSREDYQLMSMTALYIAIKVGEPVRKLSPEALVDMSRGAFSTSRFAAMEADMLQTLEWRISPPTASAYVELLLEFIPFMVRPAVGNAARQMVEMAVTDAVLAKTLPSVLAVSSILLSLLELSLQTHHYNHYYCDSAVMADEFVRRMEIVLDMSILVPQDETDNEDDVATTVQRLKNLVRSPQDFGDASHPSTAC